jgi:hypothetical protein
MSDKDYLAAVFALGRWLVREWIGIETAARPR